MVYQYLKSPDWMNNVVEAENLKQQLKLQSNDSTRKIYKCSGAL
jgi:hypothetical protein